AVQAFAVARGAGGGGAVVSGVPSGFFASLFLIEAFELQAGAEAVRAPAMLGVVREQSRVGLGKAGSAAGAGALDREAEGCVSAGDARGASRVDRFAVVGSEAGQHSERAMTVFEGLPQRLAQRRLMTRVYHQIGHRQFDGVLFVAIQPRP